VLGEKPKSHADEEEPETAPEQQASGG
jgi:hypothetical protein